MSFSFASIASWFSSTAATVEADVVKVITALKSDISVAETEVVAALNWLAGEAPTIAQDLGLVLTLASAVGGVPAGVLAAANASVAALNVFATAQNAVAASGSAGTAAVVSSAQSVVAGYKAYTAAQSAVAQAKAAAASAAAPSA